MNQYEIITISDIPFEDGTTPRQRNNAMPHIIALGSKVSYLDYDEDGKSFPAEGFVLSYIRDCDGTPLYMIGNSFDLIEIYQESDKNYHEIKEQINTKKALSLELFQLQEMSDEQVSIMFEAFKKFNHPYAIHSLEVIEESTQEKTDICNKANIIWGPEFYNRFYSKRYF